MFLKNYRHLSADNLLIFFDQVVASLSTFSYVFIATKILSLEDVGIVTLLITLIVLSYVIFQSSFINFIYLIEFKQRVNFSFVKRLFSYIFAYGLLFSLLAFIFLYFFLNDSISNILYYIFFIFIHIITDSFRRFSHSIHAHALPALLSSLIFFTKLLSFFFFEIVDLKNYLLILSIPNTIIFFYLFLFSRFSLSDHYSPHVFLTKDFYFGILTGILNWTSSMSPIFIIYAIYGSKLSAIVFAIKSLANLFNPINELLDTFGNKFLVNYIFFLHKYRLTFLFIILLCIMLLLFPLFLIKDSLILFLYDVHFSNFSYLIPLFFAVFLFSFFAKFLSILVRFKFNTIKYDFYVAAISLLMLIPFLYFSFPFHIFIFSFLIVPLSSFLYKFFIFSSFR